jgi:hypothetical protein
MADEVAEYAVVEGSAEELKKLVGDLLKDGWTPQGGVTVAATQAVDGRIYCAYAQAMVRTTGYRKSLAVTVPLVASGSTGKHVSLPGSETPGAPPEISCPHCHVAIPHPELKDGQNTCAKCGHSFIVEWGGQP